MYRYLKTASFLVLSSLLLAACSRNDHSAQGYIEGRYTYVSSQVGGTLQRLKVERGTPVTLNQPLFELDFSPQKSDLEQAAAELETAKAKLLDLQKGKRPTELAAIEAQQKQLVAQINLAKLTVIRYEKLHKTNFIDTQTLDQAASNLKNLEHKLEETTENLKTAKLQERIDLIHAAEASVKAAEANLSKMNWQISQKNIDSPVSGIVFDTYFREGELVHPNQPVVSLLAPENIFLIFYVPEPILSQVTFGQTVRFQCDSCTEKMTGVVYFISPEAEYTPPVIYSEQTRDKLIFRVEAKLSMETAVKVHPGQPVTVYFAHTPRPRS